MDTKIHEEKLDAYLHVKVGSALKNEIKEFCDKNATEMSKLVRGLLIERIRGG